MTGTEPRLIDASEGVYSWSGHDDLVHVRAKDGEIITSFVGVPDRDIDTLLDHVAGGVILADHEDPYDLVVTRGAKAIGIVHRRPGRPSTFTRMSR